MSEPMHQQPIDWSKVNQHPSFYGYVYGYDTIDPQLLVADRGHGLGFTCSVPDVAGAAPNMALGAADFTPLVEPLLPDNDDASYTQNIPGYGQASSSPLETVRMRCAQCDHESRYTWEMEVHAKRYSHSAFKCIVASCDQKFVTLKERDAHAWRPHTEDHARVATNTPFDCVECNTTLKSKADLLRHAQSQQHQPYGCICGKQFSRLDVLNRHLEIYDTEEPQFPCSYCRLHRGENGFRRADHLKQHLRNYHNHQLKDKQRLRWNLPVCSHSDCPSYRDETFQLKPWYVQERTKPFKTQAAYTKHMRDEHNECTFPCDIIGCSRIGRKGYFREKDLLKHRKEHHPEATLYAVKERVTM